MHDPANELASSRQQLISTEASGGARYGVGPSRGRSNAAASAPGVAEDLGHQGCPSRTNPSTSPSLRRRVPPKPPHCIASPDADSAKRPSAKSASMSATAPTRRPPSWPWPDR